MFQRPSWTFHIHHDGSEAYTSNPLPQIGDTVQLSLRAPHDAPINKVYIRAMMDGEFFFWEMHKTADSAPSQMWTGDLPIQQYRTDYRFRLLTDDGSFYYSAAGTKIADTPDFDSFAIIADYNAPLWVRDQVFYQIFPERFRNGDPDNDVQTGEYERMGHQTVKREWHETPTRWEKSGSLDFFGGDLQGITEKLDYLQSLGITALYLCPIFKADSNHKYDVIDFFTVDEHFGGNQALADLRAATEARDMKLMLDVTPNHISCFHEWFTAVQNESNAATAAYFIYDEEKDDYERWLGVPLLVKLNYESDELRDIMYRAPDSVLKTWMQAPYSIDAWRLDVANMTGNFREVQLDHDVWREMRHHLKAERADLYMLGEYFQDGTAHLQGDELDASMNYQGCNIPLRRWLGAEDLHGHDDAPYSDSHLMRTEALAEQWQRFLGAIPYPIALQQFNQLDSHDTTRFTTIVGGDTALLKLGMGLLTAFPGVPCYYYGTEIAMEGGRDPDNRRTMPWDDDDAWNQDVLAFTRQLTAIRTQSHALKHGGFQVLHALDDTVAYARQSTTETVIVVGYRGQTTRAQVAIDVAQAGLDDGVTLTDLLGETQVTVRDGQLILTDLTHGAVLLLQVAQA